MLSPNKYLSEAALAKGKPALPSLLALLCSAALVLGTLTVSLVSGPPPQPLPEWQCNAQDGSVTQDGVIADASLPCNWGLTEAAATSSASCAGAELLVALGRKEGGRQNLQLVRHIEDISWFNIGTVWTSSRNAGDAVLSLPRASLTATTRSNYSLSKSYENRGHGLDVEDSHAVGLPSSKSHPSTRVGACPPQWLPVLLAVVDLPPPPGRALSEESGSGTSSPYPLSPPPYLPPSRLPPTLSPSPPPSPPPSPLSPSSPPPPPPPRSPPPSPPSPPLQPGSRYALSSSDLIAALGDSTVSRIVLVAGTYEFADDMCSDQGGSALCIKRNVTIEAEVARSVVLDAKGARRVMYVSTAGRAKLVGLNVTGGVADKVIFRASIEPTRDFRIAAWIISYFLSTGWWHPHRRLGKSDRLPHSRQRG